MKVPYVVIHFLLTLFTASSVYTSSISLNREQLVEEDIYLKPIPYRQKLGIFFVGLKLPKRRPTRRKAYLAQLMTQINMLIYCIGLLIGVVITGSFDFVEETIFVAFPAYIPICYGFLLIGVFLYTKIRTYQDKRQGIQRK